NPMEGSSATQRVTGVRHKLHKFPHGHRQTRTRNLCVPPDETRPGSDTSCTSSLGHPSGRAAPGECPNLGRVNLCNLCLTPPPATGSSVRDARASSRNVRNSDESTCTRCLTLELWSTTLRRRSVSASNRQRGMPFLETQWRDATVVTTCRDQ